MGMRRLAGCLALLLGCAQTGGAPGADAPAAERADVPRRPAQLVIVSVAGLAPDRYRGRAGGSPDMPRLAARAAEGVAADAMHSVAPAARYPAHATLLSGRRPAAHGIVADRRLGERGVRATPYWHASQLKSPVLWQLAAEGGLRVAALGWPSTVGASIALNLSDLEPTRRGESWLGVLAEGTSPALVELARRAGGESPAAQTIGPARDAVLVGVACRLLAAPKPPELLLLQLGQTAPVLAAAGAEADSTRAAFRSVDAQIDRLVACAESAGRLPGLAFVVVGDHGSLDVHTLVAPNAVLAEAGLLTRQSRSAGVSSWSAIVRSNGGSAFVYAAARDDALLARRALDEIAVRTGAFRVVSAEEMLSLGADPDAWFGLEAAPGYLFSDAAQGPLLAPARERAGWGYLPDQPAMDAGFVAWGAGLRRGVRVPEMRQTDVAPTLAPLLGLRLEGSEGRVLVGLLRLPAVSALSAVGEPAR